MLQHVETSKKINKKPNSIHPVQLSKNMERLIWFPTAQEDHTH